MLRVLLLEVLVIGKQLFKQLVVPGGGVNFMVTADNFGKEDVPMGDTLGFLDDDEEGEGEAGDAGEARVQAKRQRMWDAFWSTQANRRRFD